MAQLPPTFTERAYTALLRAGRMLARPIAGRGSSKLARGIRGRRGVVEAMEAWAGRARDVGRPLVWLHAPSVGEGLQAQAVLEALQERRPDLQSVFTHFSPSAEKLARCMSADWAGYLPWDLPGDAVRAVSALRPDILVFTKTEVWPNLGRVAAEGGAATALVAATLPASSSRLGPWARRLLGPSLGRLDAVLAIAQEDAERFVALGARPDAVEVAGDPGIDSAARRAAATDRDAPWLVPFQGDPAPIVVAGSTWPADERVLVPALTRVRQAVQPLRLIVAPHEPDEGHLRPLESALVGAGWTPERLGDVEARGNPGTADAVVVDRVGVLAQLYTVATAAYVGGGFHDEGLHSVLEPAAAGVPVAFGPRHDNARAAADLAANGGGRVVSDTDALARALTEWLTDPPARARSSRAGSDYIGSHRGAAARSAEALLGLLER